VRFTVPGLARHQDDVRITAQFTSPSGRQIDVGGFATGGAFASRFLPTEAGAHRFTIKADGKVVKQGAFAVQDGAFAGFVRKDPANPRALRFDAGKRFVPLGENRINIYDKKWNYDGKGIESYVKYMAQNGMNTLRVFIVADAVAEDRPKKDQLGCLEPKVGRFDERAAKRFDRILKAAEKNGLQVVLCAHAIGFSDGEGETWKAWRDNAYNKANGGPADDKYDFFYDEESRAATKRKLDYILARWGASPALFGIDLLNEPEWDGDIPEDDWREWAKEMSAHVKAKDPFDRPVQVGSVGLHWNCGGDEKAWWDAQECDVVQWHLYGPNVYEPHALAAEMTRKIEETWSHEKPILVGEFAYGGEDQQTFDHTHAGIWSATFSGAGVLAHSAPPFNIDCDEFMFPARGAHFKALATFLATLDDQAAYVPRPDLAAVNKGARAWCLADGRHRAAWIMAGERGYDAPVTGAKLVLKDLPKGAYDVTFVDDTTAKAVGSLRLDAQGGDATIALPEFTRHVAVRVTPAG
jgi:hypothetical protein